MLTVITGPMFSGKTSELIRRLQCARIAGQRAIVLRPRLDDRWEGDDLRNHCGQVLQGFAVRRLSPDVSPLEVARLASEEWDVIGVDEAQFLSPDWCEPLRGLAENGREVIVAGLNQDFRGAPFGPMPRFLCWADRIAHLRAVCTGCGAKDAATRTWRKSASGGQIALGDGDEYEAVCPGCFSTRWRATRQPDARDQLAVARG